MVRRIVRPLVLPAPAQWMIPWQKATSAAPATSNSLTSNVPESPSHAMKFLQDSLVRFHPPELWRSSNIEHQTILCDSSVFCGVVFIPLSPCRHAPALLAASSSVLPSELHNRHRVVGSA